MRELGFLLKPSPFNSMMSLYSQLGKRNMVNKLLYEMEENKVKPDNVTANIFLKAYAAVSDVNAMEMFMRTMRVDEEGIKLKRDTMVAMAKAYVEVCSEGKAIEMYGDVAGSAGEVHTLWEVCKKKGKASEEEYRRVISSLLKLDDFEGAEKIYGEWRKKAHELELVKIKIILLNFVSMILLLAALIVPFYIFPLFVSIILVVFILSSVSSL
ncbi:putative pentatricopeptide repeat-containing protein [Cardamine amara subsp. amara]|uniref:Pentatricopeptide repeat-containing protein n=1 Tax=Cardamine amara subsp. amara TaxID=228776 RepID=A0ABD1AS35_CARAN